MYVFVCFTNFDLIYFLQAIKDVDWKVEHLVILTTYSQLNDNTRNHEIYDNVDWLMIWLDEAHKIKNKKTAAWSNVDRLISFLRFCITGIIQLSLSFNILLAIFASKKFIASDDHYQYTYR